MATQIKPSGSGAFTTITLDAAGRVAKSSTGLSGLAAGNFANALRAVGSWYDAAGQGAAAALAQDEANANGIIIQEV